MEFLVIGETFDQVGIADEGPAERNHVRKPIGAIFLRIFRSLLRQYAGKLLRENAEALPFNV